MSETTRSLIVMLRANTQPFTEGLRGAESQVSHLKGAAAKLSADLRTQISNATAVGDGERERLRIQQQYEATLERISRMRKLDVRVAQQLAGEAERLRQIQSVAADSRAEEAKRAAIDATSQQVDRITAAIRDQQQMLSAATEFDRERLAIAKQYESTLAQINSIKGIDERQSERLADQANKLRVAQLQAVNQKAAESARADEAKRLADERKREKEAIDALNVAFDRQSKEADQRAVALAQEQASAQKMAKDIKDRLAVESALTPLARTKVQIEQQYLATLEQINAMKGIERAQTQAMIADAKRLRAAQMEGAKQQDAASGPLGGLGSILGNGAAAKGVMRGIGAAMITTVVAETTSRIADGIGSVSKEALANDKSGVELANAYIGAIPVIGSVQKAMSSIGASTMDTAAAAAKWLGFSKETQRWLMSGATLTEDIKRQSEETAKKWEAMEGAKAISRELAAQRDALRTMTPLQKERQRIEDQYAQSVEKINAQRNVPAATVASQLKEAEAIKNIAMRKAEYDASGRAEAAKSAKEQIESLQAERAAISMTAGEAAKAAALKKKYTESEAEAVKLQIDARDREQKKHDATKGATDLAKSLQQQATTLGMTSEQLEIYKLKLAGATTESLKLAEAAQKKLEAAKLQKDADGLAKSLKEQAAMVGMSAEQASIYRLQMKGATTEQLASAQYWADELKARTKANQAAEQEKQRLEGLAKSAIESTRTPLEQYKKTAEDTRAMFRKGLIDRDTMNRVAKEAKEKFRSDAESERKKTESGPSLVLKDSAEAYRLQFGGKNEELKTWKDQLKAQQKIETNTREAAKANARKIVKVSMN